MGHEANLNMRMMKQALGGEILPFGIYVNGCPKCGAKAAAAMYCIGVRTNPECEKEEPHLHRCCGACQFMWSELTLDHPETPEIVNLRANSEAVLVALLHAMGGRAEFPVAATAMGGVATAEQHGETVVVTLSAP